MMSQMDDPNIPTEIQNLKTEELLKSADFDISRRNSKREVLSNSKSEMLGAEFSEQRPDPPIKDVEGPDKTVGEIDIGNGNNAMVSRSEYSEQSESLHSRDGPIDISMRSRDTLGADTIQSQDIPSQDVSSQEITYQDHMENTTSSRVVDHTGSTYSQDTNFGENTTSSRIIDHSGRISSPVGNPRRPYRGGLIVQKDSKSDEGFTLSNHSQDHSQEELTGHSRVKTTYNRGRRKSLGAYKVPYANKPKGGGGFVTVKRRYQPKPTQGIVNAPRRYSVEGVHLNPTPQERADISDGSFDYVPPPPNLNMSQSMFIAIEQLREEKEKDEAAKAERKEPKGWLYMTALFTLVCATMGLMSIILFAFGAAYGDVYSEARSDLEYLSPPGSLDDQSTPQFAALEWLVKKDGANGLDLVDDVTRREARYSLAVLYFSTEGELRWTDKIHFLSDRHECDWNVEMETGDETSRIGVICDDDRTIVELSIVGNNLRGQLPSELSTLSDLIAIDFQDNDLTGTIPDWKWENLESLHLQHNSLEGSLPTSLWAQLPYLKILDLSSNQFSSSLPNEMRLLSSIESINLGYNELTGNLALESNEVFNDDVAVDPSTLVLLNLRTFNITNNEMRGTLDFLELFPSLQVLDVTQNRLTGRLPGVLGGLSNLEALYLSDNQFFGAIPTAIGSLTTLMTMTASNNGLNRQFPWDSFAADNRLTEIIMSSNSFSGTLPENMGKFSSLEVVDFGHNLMSGTIPPSIARDIRLRILRLYRNQLEGPLPEQPTAFPETLEVIDLHSNQFVGTLPRDWVNLGSLNVLTLHDNDFEGPIPQDWDQLSSLDRVTLHLNRLEGSVEYMCNMQPQPFITANCAGNQPMVNCSCCALCLE
ncbi:MAG: hypothetical protein SGBAC_004679 [Bacillariaceae sp.]